MSVSRYRIGVISIETIHRQYPTIIGWLICNCTNRVAAETMGGVRRAEGRGGFLLLLSLAEPPRACWALHVWSVGTISTIYILMAACNGRRWAWQPAGVRCICMCVSVWGNACIRAYPPVSSCVWFSVCLLRFVCVSMQVHFLFLCICVCVEVATSLWFTEVTPTSPHQQPFSLLTALTLIHRYSLAP